jgi:KUP system potassium uptake protein
MAKKESYFEGVIKALGLVFGDIGTSPIYTLTVIFLLTPSTKDNVFGILSLIFWTLMLLVTLEYVWLAMGLSKKGEGGTIVLRELFTPLLKSGRQLAFVSLLAYVGVSLLIGDGVITPAISILSAVEGLLLVPGFEHTEQGILLAVAATIAVLLFLFQKKGTEKVAFTFGPIMVVWFLALTVSGIVSILSMPSILMSVNPIYGINFLLGNGLLGFFVLSEVILCATGGEALYADMGHLGSKPIVRGWYLVLLALVLNYMGQGAFLIAHPEAKNILFSMIFSEAQILYVPFLLLSVAATVIASQAMISGMFSVVYQGIMTRMMPLFQVDYTSSRNRNQIYIESVNYFLMFSVLIIMFSFRESAALAAAYGLAVTGTMTITGMMMTWIFTLKKNRNRAIASFFVTVVAFIYLLANFNKIPHGGYWSLLIASLPLTLILVYTMGQKKLYESLKPLGLPEFLEKYRVAYSSMNRIRGTALFFARDLNKMPPYIAHTMFTNNIIYEENVIVSVVTREEPFGVNGFYKDDLAKGLRTFEIGVGYMEVVDVGEILQSAGIHENTIFYGIEDIATDNLFWKIFSTIKKLSPSFVHFYNLPPDRLHGVIMRAKM